MFVAALSGGHRAHPAPSGPPLHVLVESTPQASAASLDQKRRREAVSAIALRQVLSFGTSNMF
jgi:hypothetical protein